METKLIRILIHASTWFAPILVPLIIFFIASEEQLKRLSIQAVIFHLLMSFSISFSIFLISTILLAIIGLPLFIGFALISFVVPIIGIIQAARGEYFEYPIIRYLTK